MKAYPRQQTPPRSVPSKDSLLGPMRTCEHGVHGRGVKSCGVCLDAAYDARGVEIERLTAALKACETHDYRALIEAHDAEVGRLTAANGQLHAHGTDMWAEVKRLREDMASMRVFIQDCIDTGHDRGALGNLYACRDIIDRRSPETSEQQP